MLVALASIVIVELPDELYIDTPETLVSVEMLRELIEPVGAVVTGVS
jgi:UDP-N-acetylmuramyl tripeptide synthase